MRRAYVGPSGDPSCKIAGVGEQPGYEEVRARPPKPFVGPAGRGLDECLIMIKLPRREMYLTNVIKDLDSPLKHYIDIDTRGKWTIHPEGYEYINELKQELSRLNLNVVVAFGNIALLALTNRVGITKWRGSVLESTLVPGLKVIPTFHPATFIPPKFNFLNKPLICEDLMRAKAEMEFKEIRRKPRDIVVKPSFEESLNTLRHCQNLGLQGHIIGLDIEVINGEVDCIGLSWEADHSICIPFRYYHGDYFTPDQELAILREVAQILSDSRIAKTGANFIFDTQFLLRKYGIVPRGELHCTQIAQKISYPDLPAGLDAVTTMHTDIPYYKQDGKQWMKMGAGSWEEWWNYNGMDALVPVDVYPKQMNILQRQNNIETYSRQRKLIKPLLYMGERGIRVDVEGMLSYKDEQQTQLDQLSEQLNSVVGYEINYNSPKQLMNYFYKELGNQPYKKRSTQGTYSDSIDVDALKRLARRGVEAARIMLDIRGLSKRISTYLNIGKVDKDGRYRSSYKPVGAETGRLSSGETIFGTGGNQQNWPHDLLRFFLFDEGYIGYSFDLSQIENRIVAYVGGVLPQIEAFEQGIDLHRLTASIIFNKPYDQISSEDGSSDLGDGRQSERYWGKKCKFKHCQVLSKEGWISISQAFNTNCKIAQWDKDGTITFETPERWYHSIYNGESIVIENQRIYQECTLDHKMPLYYNNGIIDKPIKDYPNSGKYSSPLSGIYSGNTSLSNPIIQLIVAFQADGYWDGNAIVFKLHKQRKIDRIKSILKSGGIEFSDNPSGIYLSTKNPICKFIKLVMGEDKLFGPWLLNLDQQNLQTFIEELPYWDGHIEGLKRQYFTTVVVNAIWAQTIAHLCGKAANISHQDNSKTDSFGNKMLYRVSIRESSAPATSAVLRKRVFRDNEPIYCPTMPSGYFLCREHGVISITGNSNHAINYDVGYRKFALVNEMSESEAKQVLETVHRGYPQIREGYQATIQHMLKSNRTVTNLFNRVRLFLGPIYPSYPNVPAGACADTYRQAYAHFAQSTCADKINEQGLEYIYYNQDLFKPIELLAQIHDSIVFQIPLSIPWIDHARMLLKIKNSLETPLQWHGTNINTPVDLSIGLNMCKDLMKELKSKSISSDELELANKLKEIYYDLCRNRETSNQMGK